MVLYCNMRLNIGNTCTCLLKKYNFELRYPALNCYAYGVILHGLVKKYDLP